MALRHDYGLADVKPLPPTALELAPAPLREASAAYREALEAVYAAKRAAANAAAAAGSAAALDQQAALAALQTGKATPDATAPAARVAAERADRGMRAAFQEAGHRKDAYLVAVRAHRDELLAGAAASSAAIAGPALERLDAIEDALRRLVEYRHLQRELADPRYLQGRAASFNPDPRHPSKGVVLAGQTRELLAALREVLATEQPSGNRFLTGAGM